MCRCFPSQSTIFQSCWNFSWVEPVLSRGLSFLLEDTTKCLRWDSNPPPLDLKHSTTEPCAPLRLQDLLCLHDVFLKHSRGYFEIMLLIMPTALFQKCYSDFELQGVLENILNSKTYQTICSRLQVSMMFYCTQLPIPSPQSTYELWHGISNNVVCVNSKASDQPAHMRSLIRAFASHLNILRVLSYWLNISWSF